MRIEGILVPALAAPAVAGPALARASDFVIEKKTVNVTGRQLGGTRQAQCAPAAI